MADPQKTAPGERNIEQVHRIFALFLFFFLAFFLMPSVRKWKMENADKICLPMLVLRCYGVAKLIYL